jgi:hypothetical protein
VNPACCLDDEDEASAIAEADLTEAAAAKRREGSDGAFATVLKKKGYVSVDDFQKAVD